ncbi:DNA-binding response regulator [hydrothermal vent metagenome]|uniref:DNA-binding response regulator n=1 Tax=hydrothermal vent metagenome TaxID=652676 RepID=A0A1W1CQ72_9ZZZZ
MKILLLEDDVILHESLKIYLEMEGFEISSAFNAHDVYNITFENSFDVYIFDVNLVGENGFEILKSLRESGDNTPTIYTTALVDISSMSIGFSLGADDYIKKPFDPEELVLRIKSRYIKNDYLLYKNIHYNPLTKEIYQDKHLVVLSNILSHIFDLFISNINKIISNEILLAQLDNPNQNALRVNISKLKTKLNLDIKNIRGVGYILEDI